MNAISFSLFGSHPMYCQGAIRNAELAPSIYPGWRVVVYASRDVPQAVTMKLKQAGAEVRGPVQGIANEMFWRFCAADDEKAERFIVRDADSRLSRREALAVKEWIDSGFDWHVMADHPHHWLVMGGGLTGGKTGLVKPSMRELIIKSGMAGRPYTRETAYSMDQMFLAQHVYPEAKKSLLRHDTCHRDVFREAREFPGGVTDRFVGEVFSETDKPHHTHWMQRTNYVYG